MRWNKLFGGGQLGATLTLSKYSLIATLRSPTSVVFSLLFPIFFIIVFGSLVGDKSGPIKLAVAPGSIVTEESEMKPSGTVMLLTVTGVALMLVKVRGIPEVVPTGTDPTFKSLVDSGALAEAMPGKTTAEARKNNRYPSADEKSSLRDARELLREG